MRLFKKISLPMQIVIALVLGVILGSILHGNKDVINYIQPIGDVFINLIKMIVVPIVFCSLALSISNVGDTKTIGRYGGKTLLYFVIMTSFAIFMGLVFGNLFKPGTG
ncbi:glutamate:protein symporter, partial [Staphylococcus arlettae]